MKAISLLTACALFWASVDAMAQAQTPTISLSLNLRYVDPADPGEGGAWQLVAKTHHPLGLAVINAYLANVETTDIVYGNGGSVGASTIGAELNDDEGVFATAVQGGVNLLYQQNTTDGPIVVDVGLGAGTPGNVANDRLQNRFWNNSAVIASGKFAGGGTAENQFNRPSFFTFDGNSTSGKVLAGAAAGVDPIDADITTLRVRGDSLLNLGLNEPVDAGLRAGDMNRDFFVNASDFTGMAFNFGDPHPPGGFLWDQGNWNDDLTVDGSDFNLLAYNFGKPAPPSPASGAAPEPDATMIIIGGALVAMGVRHRLASPRGVS